MHLHIHWTELSLSWDWAWYPCVIEPNCRASGWQINDQHWYLHAHWRRNLHHLFLYNLHFSIAIGFEHWLSLSTNGQYLCTTPMVFVNLLKELMNDELLWQSDNQFCLCRTLCPMTKCYAEWPFGVQSVLLICRSVVNTADGLWWMTIVESAVQSVIDEWSFGNAKRCIRQIVGMVALKTMNAFIKSMQRYH